MRIQPSTVIAGPVSAVVTEMTPAGRRIAAALTVEVPVTVPAIRRYGLALYLLSRFLEHTDTLTTVHHSRAVEQTGSVTYYFD